jgi:hypothetical protein
LKFIESQAQKTVASLTPDYSLHPSAGGKKGTWTTVSGSDWTSGFFPGELWLLYQATGSTQWLTAAQAWTTPLASQATRTDTHDVGFIIGTSFGNAYRLTGDPSYNAEILIAAGSPEARYNPTGAVVGLRALSVSRDYRQHDDAWPATVGGRRSYLGRGRGDARANDDRRSCPEQWQHAPDRQFRPDNGRIAQQ